MDLLKSRDHCKEINQGKDAGISDLELKQLLDRSDLCEEFERTTKAIKGKHMYMLDALLLSDLWLQYLFSYLKGGGGACFCPPKYPKYVNCSYSWFWSPGTSQ